jgi:PadR family transcriptional regulator PadR
MSGPDKDLMRGTLELIALAVIARNESYGYEIINSIKEVTEGAIDLKEGSLYPVLYRLEDDGAVESVWHAVGRGNPRKYYRLTAKGAEALARRLDEWRDYVRLVNRVIGEESSNG